jgi:hypothetical protein
MATVIVRAIASSPKRTATETWDVIVSLLDPDPKGSARSELEKVAGVAASSIASEAPVDDAFVVYGNGPQVRIYCVYADDAISDDGVNEDPFQEPPTAGDWRLSIPCLPEDLDWMQRKLKSISSRISARATGEKAVAEQSASTTRAADLTINLNEFLRL